MKKSILITTSMQKGVLEDSKLGEVGETLKEVAKLVLAELKKGG